MYFSSRKATMMLMFLLVVRMVHFTAACTVVDGFAWLGGSPTNGSTVGNASYPSGIYDTTVGTGPYLMNGYMSLGVYENTVYKLASGQWNLMWGMPGTSGSALYGSRGWYSAANDLGGRHVAMGWYLSTTNVAYVYGGFNSNGHLQDLFAWNGSLWNWIGPASPHYDQLASFGVQGIADPVTWPAGLTQSNSWLDPATSLLYLFGGQTYNVQTQNALFSFNLTSQLWTYIGGAQSGDDAGNITTPMWPAARTAAVSWTTFNVTTRMARFWLFGGTRAIGQLTFNDFWCFDVQTQLWSEIAGGTTNAPGPSNWARHQGAGVFGAQSSVWPGGVNGAAAWVDSDGFLWMFGGLGCTLSYCTRQLSSLWCFDPTQTQWALMWSVSENGNDIGVYGSASISTTVNQIGARSVMYVSPLSAVGGAHTNSVYVFGGYGYTSVASAIPTFLDCFWRIQLSSCLQSISPAATTTPPVSSTTALPSPSSTQPITSSPIHSPSPTLTTTHPVAVSSSSPVAPTTRAPSPSASPSPSAACGAVPAVGWTCVNGTLWFVNSSQTLTGASLNLSVPIVILGNLSIPNANTTIVVSNYSQSVFNVTGTLNAHGTLLLQLANNNNNNNNESSPAVGTRLVIGYATAVENLFDSIQLLPASSTSLDPCQTTYALSPPDYRSSASSGDSSIGVLVQSIANSCEKKSTPLPWWLYFCVVLGMIICCFGILSVVFVFARHRWMSVFFQSIRSDSAGYRRPHRTNNGANNEEYSYQLLEK